MTIEERIMARYTDFTPQARRAADVILQHRDDLATFSSAELAELSGVSRATLSRLYRQLGFASFADLREQARTLRSRGVPVGDRPVAHEDHLAAEHRNLRRMLDSTEPSDWDAIAANLRAARSVTVVGFRNSYPVALHLREQLTQLRDGVRLLPLPGQTLAEELVGLTRGDTVILVGFRRRPSGFAAIVRAVADSGADLLLIADGSARRYTPTATWWIEVPLDSDGPFDSYAAAMSAVAVLANAVGTAPATVAHERITRIAELYDDLGEIELS
ncbi:MurR/RpiR family transcriptional regulator [Microlunatus sp. GCM10028923]|uniref:MurR/RpiR family transcriptional regulator n=1 Tax=Microlunatus sp. GCM10028923 TaxID=3273400 RepID=UPI0036144FBD